MIRPIYTIALAVLTFFTGLILGYSAHAAQTYSADATKLTARTATPTLTPRQEPRTAYYIGVYDACRLFAQQAAGMSDEESSLECLGFVQRVRDASWYETSGK